MRKTTEDAVRVAKVAIDSYMSPGKREVGMIEPAAAPNRGLMAALAVLGPSQRQVIWSGRTLQVSLMASFTLDGRALEIANLGPWMATEAGNSRMRTNQRESCLVVQRKLPLRQPVVLVVAENALIAKLPTVDILMATGTPALGKHARRTAIVMATQALRLFMRSKKC